MAIIGFHASQEQLSLRELLALVQAAEDAGFHAAMSSDHFHPWTDAQRESEFTWALLGAALQATTLPMGVVTTHGYRMNHRGAVAVQGRAKPEAPRVRPGRRPAREPRRARAHFASPCTRKHVEWLQEDEELGFEEIYLHNTHREQRRFIEDFGTQVIPALRSTRTRVGRNAREESRHG